MGFGEKWRFWVRVCISSASYSLLVNETSTGLEKGERGFEARVSNLPLFL